MIEVNNLSHTYDQRQVLCHFSAHFNKGSFCAVMGPNGSGKSTLLRCIARLLKVQSGSILLEGRDITSFKILELARMISYVPQREDVIFDFSVYDTIMMGRNPYQKRWEFTTNQDEEIIRKVLEKTKLDSLKNRLLGQLSGGELRRVMIARAIAQQTPLLLLDEPLANLDIVHQFEIMNILKDLNHNSNITVIIVMHDIPIALQYATQVLLLKNGKILDFGETAEVLTDGNVKDCFNLDSSYTYCSDGVVKINVSGSK